MNLPDDLRHLPKTEPEDAFQILTGDQCVIAACALAVFALIFLLYL